MDIKLFSSCLFLHLLIFLGAHGSEATETNRLQLHSMDNEDSSQEIHSKHHHQTHSSSSSHMNHMDPSLIVFFLLEDLKQGNTMPIWFPKISSSPHYLPKEEADLIPFSSNELQNLLQIYSFSHGSPQAQAMEDTLRQCEVQPIKGEIKTCPTSFESMVDFVQRMLGSENDIKGLSTSHLTEPSGVLQRYTILKVPKEISAPKMVACHTMPYPYAVFYCHYQVSESKIFEVSLRSDNGDRVEAVGVCHMDTSQWSRNHPSFKVLGIEPGSSPVCHFFPSDNLVWIPTNPI